MTAVETFIPPEAYLARPRANTIMASVAIKGCTRQPAVTKPETRAAAPPANKQARSPPPTPASPNEWPFGAQQTAASARTLPTARSMPAGDDYQRHAAGEHAVNRGLPQRVTVGAEFEEGAVGVENRAHEHQHERQQCAASRAGHECLFTQTIFRFGNSQS